MMISQFIRWTRNNRILAPIIAFAILFGPTLGLIGGILGIIALILSFYK